jgi:hypothetical protein
VDFDDSLQAKAHALVIANVQKLLDGTAMLGGEEDRQIEQALRDFWGIDGAEGVYINGEFYDLPDSQPLRDLFPSGRPKPLPRSTDIAL